VPSPYEPTSKPSEPEKEKPDWEGFGAIFEHFGLPFAVISNLAEGIADVYLAHTREKIASIPYGMTHYVWGVPFHCLPENQGIRIGWGEFAWTYRFSDLSSGKATMPEAGGKYKNPPQPMNYGWSEGNAGQESQY
jgi:hypothetical protein